jgi:hypothetical protein
MSLFLLFLALACSVHGPFTSIASCQTAEKPDSAKEAPSPSVTNETLSLLRSLKDSGRTGTYILAVALIVVVGTAAWMIFLQRQSLTKFAQLSQAQDSQLKVIETTIRSQEFVQRGLETQHSVVKATNEELRAELQRIKQSQDALKQSVKDTIDAGLDDITKRLEEQRLSQGIKNYFEGQDWTSPEPGQVIGIAKRIVGRFGVESDVFGSVQAEIEKRKKEDANWTYANGIQSGLALVQALGLSPETKERNRIFLQMVIPAIPPKPVPKG